MHSTHGPASHPPRRRRRARLRVALLLAALALGGTTAHGATAHGSIEGRLLAASEDGGAMLYPAREVWLVRDEPQLRRELRRACAAWAAERGRRERDRRRLETARWRALDSAVRVLAGSADVERRLALLRHSEGLGDSALLVLARRIPTPDGVAAGRAAQRARTDVDGRFRFADVPRGRWLVVPAPVMVADLPSRWYPVDVAGSSIVQDLGDGAGQPGCAPALLTTRR
jgi:hypothetical protein